MYLKLGPLIRLNHFFYFSLDIKQCLWTLTNGSKKASSIWRALESPQPFLLLSYGYQLKSIAIQLRPQTSFFFFNIRKFQGPTRWSWFSSHTNHPLPHTIFPEDQLSIAGGLIITKPAETFTKSVNFSALIWTYKYCSFEPIIVVKIV